MKQFEEQIERFKQALFEDSDASDSDSSIGEALTNRGLKRKKGSKNVYYGCVGNSSGSSIDIDYYNIGNTKRGVVSHFRRRIDPEWLDHDNPYNDINIAEIMSPLTKPQDLLTHPAISSIFEQNYLSILASSALEIISAEHKYTAHLEQLMVALLGDDPSLPGPPHEVFGISPEQCRELTITVQEALEKSKEFIRCWTNVRMDLLRAIRFKNKVIAYCQGEDYNGNTQVLSKNESDGKPNS
ncbi:Clr6 and Rpd3L histone deacetylase complex subunit Rxt2 [Schizosaccharomyces pombe]|uniref:Transcriptional regulatory protein rxt2 n=1 Tax=Schizosaccharomyces pombe (strain 972 / ATCC 24843) TaxID=284812 RepID=RTX2_SCHPO|nr:histone deacetylase complex subunit Rxt2 [Schizosaccharomyces pombe]O94355.2 RecName: Full=Transcriptional regulatory protein rxt2 [Schizosaccharomyces pombe 972h-]CAA22281.2 histone deacetylase complex subunit Rxt2 [Schizosaccharomyces pombe]|eukprot:NP_595184.2 histone deacetylase complex subunit Rxt2 [Schizosaccharomyces pombe]